tara:strand:- start:82 stop:672 length:591 start_codon:yes stop_codon:yes gene_type:complete
MTLSKNPEIAKRQRKLNNEAKKKRDAAKWKKWRSKYPDLKRLTHIGQKKAKLMGLPLKYGDPREKDARTFNFYYCKCLSTGPHIYEQWTLPKTKEKQKAAKAINKKLNSDRNKNFLKRYKKIVGCTICGWKKSTWGLHFDHINPDTKRKGVAEMAFYSRETIKKEMRKCRLICANCHSIHTQQQADSGQYSWGAGK